MGNRDKIRGSLPEGSNGGTDVVKAAGVQWGKLSAKDKKPFEESAASAKAQYKKDLEAFIKEGGVVATRKKAEKKTKKAKDPNAPKRPLSAYMEWLMENRAKIVAKL